MQMSCTQLSQNGGVLVKLSLDMFLPVVPRWINCHVRHRHQEVIPESQIHLPFSTNYYLMLLHVSISHSLSLLLFVHVLTGVIQKTKTSYSVVVLPVSCKVLAPIRQPEKRLYSSDFSIF